MEDYEKKARATFDLGTATFDKRLIGNIYCQHLDPTFLSNVYLLVAHGVLYLKWAQEEVRVPFGFLTRGSIEKCNQYVKKQTSALGPKSS